VWIRGGWSLERNLKINCGYEEAGVWKGTVRSSVIRGSEAWKAIGSVDKRRQEPGKELEYQVRIRRGWSLERNWKIKSG
jgi:hypothetical protein